MISWLLFGALAVPNVAEDWSWRILLYAVLSLTVIRMLPVAISLLGAGMDWRTVAFIGWFGPRGRLHRLRSDSARRPAWRTRTY